MFRDIFLRYPHVRMPVSPADEANAMVDEEGASGMGTKIVEKKLEELTEEERDALIKEAHDFAHELERCVFEIYSEPDRNGQPHAGGKYK